MRNRLCWVPLVSMPALLVLLIGCGPAGAFGHSSGGGSTICFAFQLPADGSVVDYVATLSASGSGLTQLSLEVDGTEVARASSAPFELTLDPKDYVLGQHLIELIAHHSSGQTRSSSRLLTIQRAVPLSEIQDAIDNLPETQWYEIPNSRMEAVKYDNPDDPRGDFSALMHAASGGTYDTKRDRLIVWGGGDTDYNGNEVYAFDLATAAWIRLNDPSAFPANDPTNESMAGTHPDGSPVTRHSYDLIEYVPVTDRMIVAGGGGIASPNRGGSDPGTYEFDFDALAWTHLLEDTPGGGDSTPSAAAVDPTDGRLWFHGGGKERSLAAFDPTTRAWTEFTASKFPFFEGGVAVVHPGQERFVVMNKPIYTWDLSNPSAPATVLATTGATEIEAFQSGMDYHPPTGRLVAWRSGRSVYSLDLTTNQWTRIDSTGTVDPGAGTPRGVLGRWRYVPSRDVFIVVNSVFTNVFVYRFPHDP